MGAVTILRQLWRTRVLVAVGLALALFLGIVMAYRVTPGFPPTFKSRQYEVGIASAAVLVDSRSSQVVDVGGGPTRPNVDQLSIRARLLANLMATSPLKDEIAARAGVHSGWLIGHAPTEGGPTSSRVPEGPSASISESDPRASVLRLYVNETLPIITADTRARDAATAARIASSSIVELQRYLNAATAANRLPDDRTLVLSRLGPAKSGVETQGHGPLLGLLLFVFVFGLWCAAIIAGSGLARAWRQAAEDSAAEAAARARIAPPPPSPTAPQERAVEPPPEPAPGPGAHGVLRPDSPLPHTAGSTLPAYASPQGPSSG
ncbi:MAG TPA: hypothetical protein VGC59_08400 [Solirubrobacteraceae bacterium]